MSKFNPIGMISAPECAPGHRAHRALAVCAMLSVTVVFSGCISRSAVQAQAAANARAAYAAGQADAYRQMLQSQGTNVHVVGHVKNPDIPWTDGLTLTQVIVDAECTDQGNPRDIILTRKGIKYPVDVKAMLNGQDWPMEPGDTVLINP
jgi:hypothetical protein